MIFFLCLPFHLEENGGNEKRKSPVMSHYRGQMKCRFVAPQPGTAQALPSTLQKLSIHQHTWHCCYHGDTFYIILTFCVP